MLAEAGAAALQMPLLENMEIWYGMRHNACVFRYRSTPSQTTLSWQGTWNLELETTVLSAWKKVARQHSGHDNLDFSIHQSLDRATILSHASAIRELKLNEELIHPISLEQIARESQLYFIE